MRHPSDADLLLLSEGELDPPRAAEVRAHLVACAACRSRDEQLGHSGADYRQMYRAALDRRLPPAEDSRALLLARLASRPSAAFRLQAAVVLTAACMVAAFQLGHRTADLSKPSATLTPGEARAVQLGEVCQTEQPRAVPASLRDKVFREYGLDSAGPGGYEVDYLITPELGGADSIRNLWPQPYSTMWNAHVKDALERRLRQLVCEGKVDLPTAQRELATDWIGAYKKYFHTDRPLAGPS